MAVQATFAADIPESIGDLLDLLDALFTDGEIVEGDTVHYAAEVPTVSGIVDVDVFGNGLRYSGSGSNTYVSRGTIEDIDVYDRFGLSIVVEDFGLPVSTLNSVLNNDIRNPAALERYLMSFDWDVLLSDTADIANRNTRVGSDNVLFNLTGDDTLDGAGGDDDLFGGDGNDLMYGGTGWDTLDGGNGSDTIYGENGNDVLTGFNGSDRLEGGSGNDRLSGNGGNDSLYGGDNNDNADGGAGNDRVDGGAGNDVLFGGDNDDRIFGGSGDDRIVGGPGRDIVTGNSGRDRFEVTSTSDYDRITDFTLNQDLVVVRGTGERFSDIDLANFSYGAVATGNGWVIRFDNVNANALDSGDFVFV